MRIRGQRVVFATGYESQQYLKQNVGTLKSTFALVSEPLDSFEGWPDRSLIWESARPYFYLRTTSDDRAIIGGEDVPYAAAHKSEQLIARKTKKATASLYRDVSTTGPGGIVYMGRYLRRD